MEPQLPASAGPDAVFADEFRVGPIEKTEREIAEGDAGPADLFVEARGTKFFGAVTFHELESGALLAKAQLQHDRRLRKSVANDRARLGEAKRNHRGIGTELAVEVELLLRLVQAHLLEDLRRRRRRGRAGGRQAKGAEEKGKRAG